MRHSEFDNQTSSGWKSYPVRIMGPRVSRCHNKPTLLVQSMQGGFVTANCSECGEKTNLSFYEFRELQLWVSCPQCRKRMSQYITKEENYGYQCSSCAIYIWLADLLPYWHELI